MNDLIQKYGPWAMVTGASSGIGRTYAQELARHGFSLVLVARREDRLKELAESLKSEQSIETRVVAADLSLESDRERVIKTVRDIELGLLINNAGRMVTGRFLDQPLSEHNNLIALNLVAPMHLAHAIGATMVTRGRGGIVMVASTAAYNATPYLATYGSSKAFILSLSESLTVELGESGVDVTAICPSYVKTDMLSHFKLQGDPALDARAVVLRSLRDLGKRPSRPMMPTVSQAIQMLLARLLSRKLVLHEAAKHIKPRVLGP